jgi:hypothetical protein
MEAADVSIFRECILNGEWATAEEVLTRLGLADVDGLWVSFYCQHITNATHLEHTIGCQVPY